MESIEQSQGGDELLFTARLPRPIGELLDAEAQRERRSRIKQLVRILEERYGLVERAEPDSDAA